ncbi:MAG: NAD(+) diphosphatase [Pseudomonadota bacterium]
MRLAETVTFGGSGLERAALIRADANALAMHMADPNAKCLPIWRGKPLLAGDEAQSLGWVPLDHVVLTESPLDLIFLGLDDHGPRFAKDISAWEPEEVPQSLGAFFDPSKQRHPALSNEFIFAELRGVMAALTPREAELVATAKAVTGWHATHRFCAKCGHESVATMAGWQRDCPACGAHHFPRTDPVVIMLILAGNALLMGRSPHWPDGMYSLLAGFVEPGETIEAAVRRETVEEAGIRVGRVDYLSSQPWPFPASLMFGCRGEALNTDIQIDPNEIEDAKWVTREEMADIFAGTSNAMKPARKGAIAQFLIWNWLADRLD